ncbi:STM4015 family protein [Planosporangium sp. 12N6]|uniref:STM4015 family protein n=1 Tax=Planosporangium spinosum TaxID=3402278 RepID=UPI003CF575D3
MTIHSHVSTFDGLPVVACDPDPGVAPPADPSAVAWRIQVDDFEAPPEEFAELVEGLLERVPAASIRALVIGEWGSAYDTAPPIDLLVSLAPRLTGLRALFLGDLVAEECEISWINHEDVTPLLEAYPALEVLRVRGAEELRLRPVRHENLRELAFESGGLPAHVVRAVGECDLPALAHLELWLGVSEYGGDTGVDDLAPILAGGRFPRLRYLALCNAETADQVAAAVAAAPVVAGLHTLDLSKGILTDAGAAALLAGQPLTHLRRLDLHHHYLSDEMMARLRADLPGVAVDVSEQQTEDEYGRYTAVAE